jgi:SAM-dependent methyltransferase
MNDPLSLRARFVRRVYATHNDSRAVRRALGGLLAGGLGGRRLNVGSGDTHLAQDMLNLDRQATRSTHVVGDAQALPFATGVFRVVVSQETVEHVADPFRAVRELARVTATNGEIYLQLPFVIGYHPGPEDYWRFTRAGIAQLVEQAGLQVETLGQSVSAGTGAYRILVELVAGFFAAAWSALYWPVKAGAAVVFYPLKWLDGWMHRSAQRDRIAGGYFVIARKPG